MAQSQVGLCLQALSFKFKQQKLRMSYFSWAIDFMVFGTASNITTQIDLWRQ